MPWTPTNLVPNLITLRNLRRGDHLSVLKEGENVGSVSGARGNRGLRSRFKIERGFRKFRGVGEKKGESILEDDQYLRPLSTLFAVAADAFFRSQVSASQLMGAYQGLLELQKTIQATGDQPRIRKMAQIIQAVRDKLPMNLMNGLFLERGQHKFSLGQHISPEVTQKMIDTVKAVGNANVVNERQTNVTPELITAVYGNSLPSNAEPTWVPITEHQYTRQGIGVCHQFWRDAHEGTGVTLNWTRLTCSAGDLRRFLAFCNNDEGLMFAVSQAANQGALTGAPTMILNSGARDNNNPAPLIQAQGERVFFTFGGGGGNIGKQGGDITVTTVVNLDGNQPAFSFRNGGIDPDSVKNKLLDFGISNFKFTLGLKLRRSGNAIEMSLYRAEYVITTV